MHASAQGRACNYFTFYSFEDEYCPFEEGLEVILLDVLEVLIGAVLDFLGGSLVADDDAVGMELQGADGPPVGDGTFDSSLESASLVVAVAEDEDLAGSHHGANTNSECSGGDVLGLAAEETAVGHAGVCCQRLLTGAAGEAAARLVEGDVPVGTDATHEEVDAACFLDHLLVVRALGSEVFGVAIENMDILLGNIDVIEEVGGHEAVVALRMALGKTHIFVHVESEDVLEADATCLIGLYESLVGANGAAAGRQTEDEGLLSGGLSSINLVDDVLSCPLGHLIIVRFNNYAHSLIYFLLVMIVFIVA